MAQDSGGPEAVDKWLDRASPTYRCVVDPTHEISSRFGWVNVPAAAWIDEDGQIVRSNEGVYPAEMVIGFGLGKVRLGDNSFADATRDWIERGADSEHVWSSSELAERLKPVDDDTRLAEATFKLALHFEAVGDSERALTHFAAAQQLAPDNWNYQRQGWNHKGKIYAGLKVLKRIEQPAQEHRQELLRPHGATRREPSPVHRTRVAVDARGPAVQATGPPLEERSPLPKFSPRIIRDWL